MRVRALQALFIDGCVRRPGEEFDYEGPRTRHLEPVGVAPSVAAGLPKLPKLPKTIGFGGPAVPEALVPPHGDMATNDPAQPPVPAAPNDLLS